MILPTSGGLGRLQGEGFSKDFEGSMINHLADPRLLKRILRLMI